MTLVEDLLDAITDDSPVADVRVGLHWTLLLTEDGRPGLANANYTGHEEHGTADVEEAGGLIGRSTAELAASYTAQTSLPSTVTPL